MKTLLLILLLISPAALADRIQINWFAPYERADNTALNPDEISHYNVYVNGIPNIETVPGADTVTVINLVPVGKYVITLTTVDLDGRESDLAVPPIFHEVLLKDPKSPTDLTKTVLLSQ